MIQLTKGQRPQWLVDNQHTKTIEYIAAPPSKKPSPWRASEIVEALKDECQKKCMYCESFIDDAAYSAVKHIRPKGAYEHLVLEWSNLGLACSRCNTNKGEYWSDDADLMLLNPYADEIDKHLAFRGPLTVAAISSRRGQNTVRKLKFASREDLLLSRMRRIQDLDSRLRLWHDEADPEKKALYAEDVADAIADSQEYSAILRAYAYEFEFPVT